jgi:5-methylcytosine-specific restriction endonuclease McrA
MGSRATLVLGIVATDRTFAPEPRVGGFVGKCIHCRTKLVVTVRGETAATIEHVLPQGHGGTDDLENLALACARCNHEKGMRHDVRRASDPVFVELLERLRAERAKRWRAPAGMPPGVAPAPYEKAPGREPRGRK